MGITPLSDGSSIVTGFFNGTASFGGTTLTSAGSGDVFIAKLNADGSYAWAKSAGGTGSDNGWAVTPLSNGSSFVTGSFDTSASFYSASFYGSGTLSGAGDDDVFVALLDSNGNWASAIDTIRPTIAVSSNVSSLEAGEIAALTFTLSESSSDFSESDIAVSGGSLSSFSGSGRTYTAIFTPTADSTTNGVISVASTKFSDAAGNFNNDGSDPNNTVTLSIDTIRPTILNFLGVKDNLTAIEDISSPADGSIAIAEDTKIPYLWSADLSEWISIQGLPGLDGAQGAQGAQGLQGEKGEKGDKGDPGPAGTNGLDGINGEDGAKGEQGEKGDQGDKGDTGADGSSPLLSDLDGYDTSIAGNTDNVGDYGGLDINSFSKETDTVYRISAWDSNDFDNRWVKGSKFACVLAPRSVFWDNKITSGEKFMSSALFEFTGDGTSGQLITSDFLISELGDLTDDPSDPLQWGFVDPFGDVIDKETVENHIY